MYLDSPGVYFAPNGDPVSEDDAEAAGYDTKALAIERKKNEKLAEARAKIEAEFAAADAKATEEAEAEAAAEVEAGTSGGGWSIVEIAKGRYEIRDAGGSVVETDLSKKEAEALLAAGSS